MDAITRLSAFFGSWGMTVFSVIQEVNILTLVTGVLGCAMTAAMIYTEIQRAFSLREDALAKRMKREKEEEIIRLQRVSSKEVENEDTSKK